RSSSSAPPNFDGDHVTAAKKGLNLPDRASQVAMMAQMQNMFDFPPDREIDGARNARSGQGDGGRAPGPGGVLREGTLCDVSSRPYVSRQPDARSAGRALLQAAHDQRSVEPRRGPH